MELWSMNGASLSPSVGEGSSCVVKGGGGGVVGGGDYQGHCTHCSFHLIWI